MPWQRVVRVWMCPLAVLIGLGMAGLGATSVSRLPPAPSKRSRARDTPVLNHLPGGGPEGGHVHSLAIVATHPPTVYAAFRGGGVYTSSDRGTTWTPAERGLPPTGTCDLVAEPVSTSTLYAACFDGLFKTTNGGALWRQLDVDHPQPPVVAPSNPQVVYQPPDRGLVRSLDGGRRWTTVARSSAVPWRCSIAFVVDPLDSSRLYCSDERWLSVSTDGGLTWKLPTMPHPDAELSAIAINPLDRNMILVASSDGRTFKTTTGGAQWFQAGDGPNDREIDDLRFARQSDIVYAREGRHILRSSDGAEHWETLPSAWVDHDVTFVVDPVSPDTIYVGTSQGVIVTTDSGRQWVPRNRGITRAATSVVLHEGSPSSLFARAGRDVFTSQNGGATWEAVQFEGEMAGLDDASLSSDGRGGVLLHARSGVFRLAREAREWTREVIPAHAQALAGSGYRPRILATTPGDFVYSTGGEWRDATRPPNGVVPRAIISAGPPGALFASTGGILPVPTQNGIWRSDDDGRTWRLVHAPNTHTIGHCCGLMADPNDPNTIYAIVAGVGIGGGGDIVSRTTDAGLTWTELNLPGLSLAFALVPTVPTTIIAQLYGGGLVRSTDGGDSWTNDGSGLPEGAEITNVVFDPRHPTTLFAGTTNRGVYRRTDAGASWQPTGRVIVDRP